MLLQYKRHVATSHHLQVPLERNSFIVFSFFRTRTVKPAIWDL